MVFFLQIQRIFFNVTEIHDRNKRFQHLHTVVRINLRKRSVVLMIYVQVCDHLCLGLDFKTIVPSAVGASVLRPAVGCELLIRVMDFIHIVEVCYALDLPVVMLDRRTCKPCAGVGSGIVIKH